MAGWHFTYEPEVLARWNDGPPPLSSAALEVTLRRVPPVCLPALVAHEHEEAQRAETRRP
jgi:hypothetical protein